MKVRCEYLADSQGRPGEYSRGLQVGLIYHVLSIAFGTDRRLLVRLLLDDTPRAAFYLLDEARSGAEDQLGPPGSGRGPSRKLVNARVEAGRNYRWSSYPAYAGNARKPGWLTTETIYRAFGDHTLHSLQGIAN
jgi:hypothetical protein